MSCIRYTSASMKRLILAGQEPEWLRKHPRRSYIVTAHLATPFWVTHAMMKPKHIEALRKSNETGVPHVMDHIIPLQHPHVCGLNVPWNIQVVPKAVNTFKSNKWYPDQLGLFDGDHRQEAEAVS